MQLKPITGIIVLSLVVASLLVAGCTTTNNTNQTSNATTSAATQHDALLEKYLTAYKTNQTQDSNQHVQAWELTWINSTSVHLEWTRLSKTTNMTENYVNTIMVFPTSQDATQYLNAMNKTAYSLASTEYPPGGGPYQKATGYAPQIYKRYDWNEGNPLNISEYKFHAIQQIDNIVFIMTEKELAEPQ